MLASDLSALTPATLSAILKAHGHLTRGVVTEVELLRSFETPPSLLAQLRLGFAPGTQTTAPTALLCKWPKPHKLARGRREQRFYVEVAPLMGSFPLVPCFGAAELPPTGWPLLLLADLSASHTEVARADLAWSQIETMVALLARLHAHWWEHPALPRAADDDPVARCAADVAAARHGADEFFALYGAQLPARARRVFERYLADGETLLCARARRGPLTLCHPDSHQGNVLFPRVASDPAYLIDWHGYQR